MITPKVLIVNDNAASLLALESLLTSTADSKEYIVITAHSGEEALRQVLQHEFAVILLDVNMPGMDGFETAEAIHSHPRAASVPIIFVTAHFSDEINRVKGYQKGAVDYLLTPVIPQILQTKVSVFVELTKKNLELQEKTQELAALNRDLRVQRMRDLERINATLEMEITERRQAEHHAHELATRDPLTGLLNRRSLIERMEGAIMRANRRQERMALLFLDLDKFKTINDTLGHDVGDELLRQVAARITASVRESDMVARFGGDEFVVLLEGLTKYTDAAKLAKKIVKANSEECGIGSHKVKTSVSIGISLYPQDGTSAQELMRNADLAMYQAKQEKRGGIQFFHENLNARLLERVQLEHELQLALAKGEFELYYQPKVEILSGRVAGVEALLRWRHPRLGLIAAAEFISAIVDSGQLGSISEWVLTTACAQARRWLDSGSALLKIPIAINIAVPQLRAELPGAILSALRTHDLPPSSLQLEITESLLIRDLEKATAVLQEISKAGIMIAIDDFGTGYSSLSVLNTLPIGILKIDQSFICGLGKEPGNTAIVAAIINMARALALRVVAEGVENKAQVAILKDLGCDEYQGHLFSEALPADALLQRLQNNGAVIPD